MLPRQTRTRPDPRRTLDIERLEDRSTPAVVYTELFNIPSGLPTGWTSAIAVGTNPGWAVDTASQPTPATDPAPPSGLVAGNSVRVDDPGALADKRLTSPVLAMPNSPGLQLRFRHNFNLEAFAPVVYYDGGVLEVSIAGGAFVDILAAGGSFASGGYVGVISTGFSNPIGGRQAWSGTSNGWVTTVANLPAAATGKNLQFRWRMGSDTIVSAQGWRVDSVQVGTPNISVSAGNGQTARVGDLFPLPLVVAVAGEFGGLVPGVPVTFSAPGGGPSATFPSGATAVSDGGGLATLVARANGVVGAYTVTAEVTGAPAVTFNLTNSPNQAPTGASTGGPYTFRFGEFVTLTASATDPEGDTLGYSWDLNGDGTFGDATGRTPLVSPAQLAALGIRNGFSTTNLKVRVSDPFDSIVSPASSFTIQNQIPIGVSAGGPYSAVVGSAVTFTATATDPDGDALKYLWDLNGDGTFGDAEGRVVSLTAAQLAAVGVTGGFSTANLKVRVTDVAAAVDSAAVPFQYLNTPPVPPPPPPPPTKLTAVAAGPGGGPHVKVYNADGSPRFEFFPYALNFTGGVSVATGDVTGDRLDDVVTAAMSGGGPHIKVYNGATGALVTEFFAYDPNFTGGVNVAVGDVNADGKADVVTGAGAGGGPHVKAFSGADGSLLHSFFAYAANFAGGVSVAAGDVDADGRADVVTGAGAGGGPHVKVFSGKDASVLRDFFAFDPRYTGGVNVAAGDVDADGRAEVFAGQTSGGSRVSLRGGPQSTEMMNAVLFNGQPVGVKVALKNLAGAGSPQLVVAAGPGSGSTVQILNIDGTIFREFAAFAGFNGGVNVG